MSTERTAMGRWSTAFGYLVIAVVLVLGARGDEVRSATAESAIALYGQTPAVSNRLRSSAAGAVAAAVWAAQEPLDQKVFGCDYSDVAVLGKGVTRRPRWRAVGLAIHVVNGAAFGLAFHETRRRRGSDGRGLAVGMALAEHAVLYPLCFFIDRFHPARGEPGVPPLLRNPRAFAQATWRHALFGVVLGRLA